MISDEDYSRMFSLQQASMAEPDKLYDTELPVAVAAVKPVQLPVKMAESTPPAAAITEAAKPVDYSGVQVGSVLLHKAFGRGTVTGLDGSYIKVTFDGAEKRFLFPGAILQGFL